MNIPEFGKSARSSVMRFGVFLLLLGGCLLTPPTILYNSYLVTAFRAFLGGPNTSSRKMVSSPIRSRACGSGSNT